MKKSVFGFLAFCILAISPVERAGLSLGKPAFHLSNATLSDCVITDISAGTTHNLALDSDGNVWAWGDNSAGQLWQAG